MLTGLCSVCYQDQIYYCKIKLPQTFLGHKFCHHLKQKGTCSIFGMSHNTNNAQKMKFSIKNFFSKWDQIRSFRWIWSHLLNKSVMENFIFCAVKYPALLLFGKLSIEYLFTKSKLPEAY